VPDDRVAVGKIVGVFGLKGMVKVNPLTNVLSRFASGSEVWAGSTSLLVEQTQRHKEQLRIKFRGVDDPDEAEKLRGRTLHVPTEVRPQLASDEFLDRDLVGLMVFDLDGEHLGKVSRVVPAPAADLLDVSGTLVPMVSEFVKEIDLEKGQIMLDPVEGMFSEDL
jgi:16S rRNA processing protein RimM